ncbi:TetR/AcrR family transcriptional regulator [Streptomyces somaliensis DSM 40738]|uniref:TetR/AcrR family transcriptional regulator n=1 Tax=Streptomyces somaliensis (strain ATCC 33201 / DSM 40738 / JCM 12659 / KCTC 9044 / NCTC 11332 / NRRL B-12077 / IP 733) TaxID=1134445 RepID=A0AA44DHJ8_STRE0|nr:TetR/AcrR family transcriptional regulator [Streptomyces somaliensis]MCQ0021654.1 TetR/AcrR family transcriptional regulator [Streptomyces somaliensis DSM 40738]NKY16638.1 TetR/AcrR family transcriptional regulator [Streptomyces somaliensis DSM 40738]
MAVARTPRGRWIEEGLRALAEGGPQAVRVEALAQALGVSKGGFYWSFGDRGTLLHEMLETWEKEVTDEVIERVEDGGGDARTRLWRLIDVVPRLTTDVRTDLAVRDWARRDPAVAERLRRVDTRRMDYLRALFSEFCPDAEEAEARSMIAFSVWIGNHLIAAEHPGRDREEVSRLVWDRLLV